jgi:hypothetical protein
MGNLGRKTNPLFITSKMVVGLVTTKNKTLSGAKLTTYHGDGHHVK